MRAPSTLGTFLREFTFGHVRQFDAVAARFLVNLTAQVPLLAGADQAAYLDIDDTIKATYGHPKEGVGYGYSKVKGLNALLAIVSTPFAAPLIAASRLRKGSTNSAKGASRLVADALVTARKAGATAMITVRADSAYYIRDVIAAARRGGAHFSITARMDAAVTRAVTQIPDDGWTPIEYLNAIFDEEEQRWVSDAEVAEIGVTAFTSWRRSEHIGARLILRRVKRLNPTSVPAGQGALLATWRHHVVFTTPVSRCWRPRPPTATTPSSSRSSPT
jgi:phosphoribosylcarboxyaminoimidazole (NCAIR) mutase